MAIATDLDYSSLQDIREESGHQHIVKLETPSGLVNSSNTVFTVGRTYIVDRDYDDTIDVATASGDVIVYDDNVAVTVNAVDTTTGVITLGAAPATSSVILVTYAYSLLSDVKVGKYRDEAIDYVHRKVNGIIDFGAWTNADDSTGVPGIVQTVVRIYAAGLILIRDHGLNADGENTSKDGYKRLATAKSLLSEYLEEVGSSAGASTRTTATSRSDGNIFYRNTDLSTWNDSVDSTEAFMRKDN